MKHCPSCDTELTSDHKLTRSSPTLKESTWYECPDCDQKWHPVDIVS